MKVLMLSTDRKILEPGSKAALRIAGYASFAEIKILMVTKDFFKALREGNEMLKNFTPDVVSAQDPFLIGILGVLLARRAKARLQVQIHTDFMSPAYIYESPRHFIESVIARWVLPRSSCVRVVSKRIADEARKLTNVPVSILPIRVPPSFAEASEGKAPKSKSTFVTISRLTSEKRIELVIDAIAAVPGAELNIIGEGKLRGALEARARNRGVAERVHFLGWQENLAPYHQSATAFIQMSKYEGYGMALMEAALAGCPLITTDVGVVGDALPYEDVQLVTDAYSLARAMTEVMKNPHPPAPPRVMTEAEYHEAYAAALRTCTQ
jgi:glycosyltransferase involved in cell wall biosynthesis